MKRTDIDEILADMIAGEGVAAQDEATFGQWRDGSAANRDFLGQLKALRMPDDPDERPGLQFSDIKTIVVAGKRRRRLRYYSAAAAAALLTAVSVLLTVGERNGDRGEKQDALAGDFAKPTLTLSNGEKVVLGESGSITDGNHLIKAGENSLVYNPATDDGQVYYNTLSIPRGGEYTLRFADGTVIYLNSGTELRYPVSFAGDTREVYLSGEAYFVVESDGGKPFIVHAGGIDVKVTGTSFNVNAYPGRQTVTTTLEEGAVQLLDGIHTFDMTPGMVASYDKETAETEIRKIDTRYYTSWKDGYIYFDNVRMEEIMDVLSMWYDLDVVYLDEDARDARFGARCTRYEDVAYLLGKFAEAGDVDFTINGRSVTVCSKR